MYDSHGACWTEKGMKSTERVELERMALMAEVAREFVHECANFLNTIRLQFAIWQQSPDKERDWTKIQAESTKLFTHLQQWNEFRLATASPGKVDVKKLLTKLAADLDEQNSPLAIVVDASSKSAQLSTSPGDLRRLFLLVLECMSPLEKAAGADRRVILIRIVPSAERILVYFYVEISDSDPYHEFAPMNPKCAKEGSLLAATCRALAFRLEGELRIEEVDGKRSLVLDFSRQPL
jgi:hypothetical protein